MSLDNILMLQDFVIHKFCTSKKADPIFMLKSDAIIMQKMTTQLLSFSLNFSKENLAISGNTLGLK